MSVYECKNVIKDDLIWCMIARPSVCVLQVSPVLLPDSVLHEEIQGCLPHLPTLQQSAAR